MATPTPETPPNSGNQQTIPNQRALLSDDEQRRWNRITGNMETPDNRPEPSTWNSIAGEYPEPDWRTINRRVPHVNLSAADAALLDDAVPLDPPHDDLLDSVLDGLRRF